MSDPAWEMEREVEANVRPEFAWSFRTDVRTWNDPPAEFTLQGAFAPGSLGLTKMPGQDPMRWKIGDVQPGRLFTIEMPMDGAIVVIEWRFEALEEQRTKLIQRVTLSGEQADVYMPAVQAAFGPNLEPGMKRIVAEMEATERLTKAAADRPDGRAQG